MRGAAVSFKRRASRVRTRQEGAAGGECGEKERFGIDWSEPGFHELAKFDSESVDATGRNPGYYAVRNCAAPSVLYALADKGAHVHASYPLSGAMPLANAALLCPRSTFDALLFLSAYPDAQVPDIVSLLHLAVARNMDIGFVRALVDGGADLEMRNNKGRTPLHSAFLRDRRDIVTFLLSRGASPNFLIGGVSAAHIAAGNSDRELLSALIRAGADINARDANVYTPLFYAAKEGVDPEPGSLFSLAGANVNEHDSTGISLLHLRCGWLGRGHCSRACRAGSGSWGPRCARGHSFALYALRAGADGEVVSALLRMGEDLDMVDSGGNAPVILAVRNARGAQAVEVLATAGANFDVTDSKGRSLLHIAVQSQNRDAVAFLLDRGAHIQAKNDVGHSPLHLAVLSQNAEIAALLLNAVADPLAKDGIGQSALELAASIGIDEPAETLFARAEDQVQKKEKAAVQASKEKLEALNAAHAERILAQQKRREASKKKMSVTKIRRFFTGTELRRRSPKSKILTSSYKVRRARRLGTECGTLQVAD